MYECEGFVERGGKQSNIEVRCVSYHHIWFIFLSFCYDIEKFELLRRTSVFSNVCFLIYIFLNVFFCLTVRVCFSIGLSFTFFCLYACLYLVTYDRLIVALIFRVKS